MDVGDRIIIKISSDKYDRSTATLWNGRRGTITAVSNANSIFKYHITLDLPRPDSGPGDKSRLVILREADIIHEEVTISELPW